MYDNVDSKSGERVWTDLCRGPHLPTTRRIPAVKLMRSAAAYWRGSEKNPQLQRIYGTAWASRDDLKALYLAAVGGELLAKREHRLQKLGMELDLFSFPDELGSGLAVFHPKGGVLRKEMEDYSRAKHLAAGYEFVNTPHITKAKLYEISGHLDWYADGMFPPMHLDAELGPDGEVRKPGQDYYLKPMNCPFHCLIFRSRGRSYRELPLRLFEFGSVYRYEKSGVVHGLTRVRGMTQDDAHIYCTVDQVKDELRDELTSLLTFVLDLLKDYGLDDFYLELSTKDPEKSIGSDEIWETATETLHKVAVESGLELVPDPGGAAFYGPKISVQARDAIGRTWQMSTIQLDFMLPERFGLEYRGRRRAASAGHDPPGALRLDRAFHRRAHRALRRRLPAMARAGAGRDDPHRRAEHEPTTCDEVVSQQLRAQVDPGRGGRLRRPGSASARSVPRSSKRFRSCSWPALPTRPPVRCRSATATQRSATAFRSSRRSRRSSTIPCSGATTLRRRRRCTRPPISRDRRATARAGVARAATCDVNVPQDDGQCARRMSMRRRHRQRQDFAGEPDALRPAMDAAPDGVHRGAGQAAGRRGRRRQCPFCRGAAPEA